MEITESSTKQSEEVDRHWVEEVFPPRFTFQDLLEDKCHSSEEPRISSRRQIYLDVLKEVKEQEEKRRRSNLATRITRDDKSKSYVKKKQDPSKTLNPEGRICTEDTRIWNEADISKLRAAMTEQQRDLWRIREQLRSSEEQLKTEREERKRLQKLMEEREEQLCCSRKEVECHSLVVKSLKTKMYQKDTHLQKFAKQIQENTEEGEGLRAELKRTKDGYRQCQQELIDLTWEMERVKKQQKIEGQMQAEEAKLEYQAATVKLQKELEEARAELRIEKESHRQTLTALELLRRHFSSL